MSKRDQPHLQINCFIYSCSFRPHGATHHFYTRISSHNQANQLINALILYNMHLSFPEWWDLSQGVTRVQVEQVRVPSRNWTWEHEPFQQIHSSHLFLLSFPVMPESCSLMKTFFKKYSACLDIVHLQIRLSALKQLVLFFLLPLTCREKLWSRHAK